MNDTHDICVKVIVTWISSKQEKKIMTACTFVFYEKNSPSQTRDMRQGPLIMYSFLHYAVLTLMSTYVSPWGTTRSPKQKTDVQRTLNGSWAVEEPWSVSAVRIKNESARQSGGDGHVFVQLLRGSQWDRKWQSDEGRKGAAGSLLHHLTLCLSCWACFRLGRRPDFPRHSPLTGCMLRSLLVCHSKRGHQFLLHT